MTGIKRRLLGLCLPAAPFILLDMTMTLCGQSAAYWDGDYFIVNEASPTLHHLLALHPLAFAVGAVVYVLLFVALVLLLPDTLALIVTIAATFGSVFGAGTWLLFRFQFGYQAFNALVLLAAIVLGMAIRYGWQARPAEQYVVAIRPIWRWLLVAGLVAIAIYVAIWPRAV